MSAITRLQKWFAAQCNGDWEHLNGIKIETTDNPGWWVQVDISGTTSRNLSGKGKHGPFSWEAKDGLLHGYDEETGDIEGLITCLVDLLESNPAPPVPRPW